MPQAIYSFSRAGRKSPNCFTGARVCDPQRLHIQKTLISSSMGFNLYTLLDTVPRSAEGDDYSFLLFCGVKPLWMRIGSGVL